MTPRANLAVVSRRSEPADSLDYFPTPPWATRALMTHVVGGVALDMQTCAEPCCGEGHMAAVLAEYFGHVDASDIFDYGYGRVADALREDPAPSRVDWVITNPPFNRAADILQAALRRADRGVALLLRSVWMHGARRYGRIFKGLPPTIIAPFCERVSIVKGQWDPSAKRPTDYSWFVWQRHLDGRPTRVCETHWIPPGQRLQLTRNSDYDRFAARTPLPLMEARG